MNSEYWTKFLCTVFMVLLGVISMGLVVWIGIFYGWGIFSVDTVDLFD